MIETDLISVWGMGIDLISFKGSELTWLLCASRKLLVFSLLTEINSIFESEHRNRLDIRVGIEINLISVIGPNLTLFLWPRSN